MASAVILLAVVTACGEMELEPKPVSVATDMPTQTVSKLKSELTATATLLPTAIPTPTLARETPAVAINELDEIEQTSVITQNNGIHSSIPTYMDGVWLCANSSAPLVDDLSTEQSEDYSCSVTVEYTDEFAIVKSNGIPNHDYESGLGCCAAEVDYEWKIPLKPELASSVTYAPKRGAIAISVNGVPFFGPEEGPGGDAVALHFEYFVEDRQPIVLGLCGGHSAGTTFHYHFDGNCVHWHPDADEKEWKDWDLDFLRKDESSPVIGFAFDGYPIYGPYGNDAHNQVKEMTSSYRLEEGKDGYGGIDDWEYVKGLGDLDECNGITSGVPGLEEALYHYHASKTSGSGEIGFPYFILCYSGVPETSNMDQGVQGPGAGMQPGGNNPPPPPLRKPDCLPPNPPPGRDAYPPDWSDLSLCS
jgi:hypothetical protein